MHSVILFPCILYRNIRLVEAYKVLPISNRIRPLVTLCYSTTPSKLDIELCTLRLLSIGIFASLCPHISSFPISFLFQESLKPDLLISNLNRTNSSSGDLNNRVSYNDLCFPKISNYGSMKKKKHCNVGVECKLGPASKNQQYG